MSVEGTLAKIHRRQFRVQNLYEHSEGGWKAVLVISGLWEYAYGDGATIEDALKASYNDAKRKKGEGLGRVLEAKTKKAKAEALNPMAQLRKHVQAQRKRKRARLA